MVLPRDLLLSFTFFYFECCLFQVQNSRTFKSFNNLEIRSKLQMNTSSLCSLSAGSAAPSTFKWNCCCLFSTKVHFRTLQLKNGCWERIRWVIPHDRIVELNWERAWACRFLPFPARNCIKNLDRSPSKRLERSKVTHFHGVALDVYLFKGMGSESSNQIVVKTSVSNF